jgi:signal transduction histidine kinase
MKQLLHDLNNKAMIIAGNAELALDYVDDEKQEELIKRIVQSCHDLKQILIDFKARNEV